ncbi:MAG: YqaJ viral recombinase family protein, partial [Acidobacteria bacterium]|nr:YqaJ viral recombinase family protein [Acidobacteriota bacterium]
WFAERAGHATASRFADVLATIKTGEAATRRNYRLQLVTERLTGLPCDTYQNAAMAWGTATEAAARQAYEVATGEIVEQVGFIKHPDVAWAGASPDGVIGRGGLELKCPFQSTIHVMTLQGGMPSEHVAQVQGQIWCCGFDWVDFVSFDPRMPEKLRLYVERVKRDEAYIAKLAASVKVFLDEVERDYQSLLSQVK